MKPHSKILFWLLVAATAAVDAVALAWLIQAGSMSRAAELFDALVTGQLAVVCIWAVFAARRMWSSLLAIGVAVVTCTAIEVGAAWISARESFGSYACLAAAIVAGLWILKQTPFWRRLSTAPRSGWQFSVSQVLVVTTLVALLLASLKETTLVTETGEWRFLAAVVTCDLLVVLSCVISSVWLRDWWLRLAFDAALAIAIGVALVFAASAGWLGQLMTLDFRQTVIPTTAYMLVVALVLFCWLELAPILPIRRAEKSPPTGRRVNRTTVE